MKNKQLFFSHTWKPDNLNRNTHCRVYEMVKKLRDNGWTTWFDEEDMGGNIDAAMAEGIENADAILICLTETYCKKVNETAKNPRNRDNCLKEWTYANMRNKLLIPVIMEPCLLDMSNWPPGIVSLYLGSTLYINASDDDLSDAIIDSNKFLLNNDLVPHNKVKNLFINVINKSKNKESSPKKISILKPSIVKPPNNSPKLARFPSQKSKLVKSPNNSPKLARSPSQKSKLVKSSQLTFRKKVIEQHRIPPSLPELSLSQLLFRKNQIKNPQYLPRPFRKNEIKQHRSPPSLYRLI